eukprot:1138942-Pelagomonas_calceolata.AAC.5
MNHKGSLVRQQSRRCKESIIIFATMCNRKAPPTFMTDTMGSASSARMPTTELTCNKSRFTGHP